MAQDLRFFRTGQGERFEQTVLAAFAKVGGRVHHEGYPVAGADVGEFVHLYRGFQSGEKSLTARLINVQLPDEFEGCVFVSEGNDLQLLHLGLRFKFVACANFASAFCAIVMEMSDSGVKKGDIRQCHDSAFHFVPLNHV
jgi:hypothetical protein